MMKKFLSKSRKSSTDETHGPRTPTLRKNAAEAEISNKEATEAFFSSSMNQIVAIHVGTTNASLAVFDKGKVKVIPNALHNNYVPCIVAFTSFGNLVGDEVNCPIPCNDNNTVFDAKRIVGRKINHPAIQSGVYSWPFMVTAGEDGECIIEADLEGTKYKYAPNEIMAMILANLKKIADYHLSASIHKVVLTVPPYFNEVQKKAMKDSASIAGLDVITFITESTAQALAYGIKPSMYNNKATSILAFHLGGSSIHISIIKAKGKIYEIRVVGGDINLGGRDFDTNLVDYCVHQFTRKHRQLSDITKNPKAMKRLRMECERAKITLSAVSQTVISLDGLHQGQDFRMSISRAIFEELNLDLFHKCIDIINSCIADEVLNIDDLDNIILGGGSWKIPKLQEMVGEVFYGKELLKRIDAQQVCVIGAGIYAGILDKEIVDSDFSEEFPFPPRVPLGTCIDSVVPKVDHIQNTRYNQPNSSSSSFKDGEIAVGIDLGTTNSCVAVLQHNNVEVIANDQGNRTTPSMVAFTLRERLVGEAAKYQSATNPLNTLFDIKRIIGKQFNDTAVQRDIEPWPFSIVCGDSGEPLAEVTYKGERKRLKAEEISSMILSKLKEISESFLGVPVHKAVITVPAYFNDSQRQATKDAATIAGFEVSRIINEPSAAAIAHGMSPDQENIISEESKSILLFDLGGGTFDVSVIDLSKGKFEVRAVGGSMEVGGVDFDRRLLEYCIKTFNSMYKGEFYIMSDAKALRRLRAECERAKRSLSVMMQTVIDIDALHQGKDFHVKITRALFEQINADLFGQCIDLVRQCIADAEMKTEEIDEVVLVGGSTRIPKLKQMLQEMFGDTKLSTSVNPDEAVAIGAAIHAAQLVGEIQEFELVDVTPMNIGVSIDNGMMSVIVPKNTPIPTQLTGIYTTTVDNQKEALFKIYEGGDQQCLTNNFLGEIRLSGIPKAPAGAPDIVVCFEVDVDGLVKVCAEEKKSGVSSGTVIFRNGARPQGEEEEMSRMLSNASIFKRDEEEAKKRRSVKEGLQKFIVELKEKVNNDIVHGRVNVQDGMAVDHLLEATESWAYEQESADVNQFEEKMDLLRSSSQKLYDSVVLP